MAELITEPPGTPRASPLPRSTAVPRPASSALFSMPELGVRFKKAEQDNTDAMEQVKKATTAREEALAPREERITAALKDQPAGPKLQALPENFQHQGLSKEQMTETMSTMFAFAAIGGAMTRQPMTAAMNSFAKGLQGLAQGDEMLFRREAQEFDRNLKVAIAKNNQAVTEYQAAMEKHKGNLSAMMTEWRLIAAKHNDTVGAAQVQAQNAQGMMKHVESLARMEQNAVKEQQRHEEMMKRMDVQAGQHAATLEETRRFHDAQIANWGNKDVIARERNNLKAKAAEQGGKPTATERQHYMDSNRLVKDVERVEGMLKDPALKAAVDAQQLGGILSDTVESKLIQQYLVRPNLDPKVKDYLTAVNLLRNQYYLDQSGKAVTGGEALRNYGAVVQPGDTSDDTLRKMEIMRTRAGERMKDYETYFPTLAAVRGGGRREGDTPRSFGSEAEAAAAGLAPGTPIIINGVRGKWQ